MFSNVSLGLWAEISDTCPMRFNTNDESGAVLIMGGDRDSFEVHFTLPALQRFLDLAQEALTQAKAERVEQGAE
ncbi:hypothetical protein ACTG9Q_11095 [Actinokineospora sp. 24-640]